METNEAAMETNEAAMETNEARRGRTYGTDWDWWDGNKSKNW